MILDPSRAREEVALPVGHGAADDNGRQLEARPPQLRELRSELTLQNSTAVNSLTERGTRNVWDLEV